MRARGGVAVLAALVLAACAREPEIQVVAGLDRCHECNMIIDEPNQAAGFLRDGEFITFDSPGCLLRYIHSLPKSERPLPEEIYLADYRDGGLFQASRSALLLTSHVHTVMSSRVISFSEASGAMAARQYDDEVVTDWHGYRVARGPPDASREVTLGPEGFDPEVIEVEKGDLVLLQMRGRNLDQDLLLSIRGYPEAGAFTIPASGEVVEVRFLATRPGSGFPIAPAEGSPLGMLRVSGSHTADEDAQG